MSKSEANTKSKKQHYILFYLGNEVFVINVKYVIRVLPATTFTKIPQSPGFLLGVTNFNGSVLPVVDSYKKFNFKPSKKNDKPLILVLNIRVNGKNTHLGFLVDDSNNVIEVADSEIKPYPATGNKFNVDYIDGVIQLNGKFILILNPEKLFEKEAELSIENEINTGKSAADNR
ncbi:chemotaxis protein CheW [Candidatus Sulfidibacterium hydrothermale]|uniref:chemotaxis protein CheW n=1 Tax=Candidatus Sulfidibacterium hydrothermale TaxID=2875962 RepID=UPI001F0ACF58|nr:chemotaxis protein CheW [Candidatus Sulfidibacterium hydrothermale]UBM61865.1 chemotaxis protein CheW [Candidatus Sulfidibacterium hydrothermale]